MDHEYSLSGKVWNVGNPHQECFSQVGEINGIEYTFLPMDDSSEYSVVLLDKDKAASLSDEDVVNFCRQISIDFLACVRLSKLHEEYGLLNVFNGGSDYEVVASDRFTCEFEKGTLISREKISY